VLSRWEVRKSWVSDAGFEVVVAIRVSFPQIEARDDVNGDGVRTAFVLLVGVGWR